MATYRIQAIVPRHAEEKAAHGKKYAQNFWSRRFWSPNLTGEIEL
jgi:hypothetical protein